MATLGEFDLIARFFTRAPRAADVVLGIGDDAALIAPTAGCELVLTTDMLVSGRHFHADVEPGRLGHKTLAVNLSDLAAMGARPRYALLACAFPASDADWLAAFANGFLALAERHAVDLVGGDTTRGPLNLCVTAIGEVPAGQALRRDGARPGDDVYVSGTLGDAALALAAIGGAVALSDDALAACRRRLELPEPRVALGLALRGLATAAIDVSDGLTGDLGHIAERSGVGARIDLARLPAAPWLAAMLGDGRRALALSCLLAGGDDYELCFTAGNAMRERIVAVARELGLPLTRVGKITAARELVVRDESGAPLAALPRAFDHFART
ncbi:MAG: thiamine-phosphate kinase [Betaproteobacteria bacterium]|jgi:thiamine-monophosphate kinase|nr:thiamine-phosphate kinase [Betaproteobacteria bacterium]MBK8686940.1 thiamine-phosphate kinase [Betaproteobacteria bacterium]MBK9677191.1 thiamine-phosphate kinase [Betaproteobacteria bacterium]MBK9703059.1 thiamine-phosphate kinase [Betaproteobacteria bacterium]